MALNQAQLEMLGTATVLAEAGTGFQIDAERVADRIVCDQLVESGHLSAIEDVDGGYQLSKEMANAIAIDAARARAEAGNN